MMPADALSSFLGMVLQAAGNNNALGHDLKRIVVADHGTRHRWQCRQRRYRQHSVLSMRTVLDADPARRNPSFEAQLC